MDDAATIEIDQSMIASWESSGATATCSARHLRVMVGWLRETRRDRPLRPHEEAMLTGYLAELGRRSALAGVA